MPKIIRNGRSGRSVRALWVLRRAFVALGGLGCVLVACSSDDDAIPPNTDGGVDGASDTGSTANDVGTGGGDTGSTTTATNDSGVGDASADGDATNAAADADADASLGSDARAVVGYQVLGEVAYAFSKPYALAVDSTDHLYVSEQTDAPDTHTLYLTNRSFASDIAPGHSRILEFDQAGAYLGWIGKGVDATTGHHTPASTTTAIYGYDPGSFNMIRGMTFDPTNDHLFVLDNWRIQELDNTPTRQFIRWTGFYWIAGTYGWRTTGQPDSYAGPNIGGFTWPSTLRIHGGRLWVGNWFWNSAGWANGNWNAISALDMTTGLGVGWLGGASTSGAATTSGYFTVGDAGTLKPASSIAHSVSPGVFCSPRHFVWHGDRIYVVDNTSDPVLSVFDENGVMQAAKLNHLTGNGEKPFAIAVDKYGNVIISDMYSGSVRFFSAKLDGNSEFTQVAEWQVDAVSNPNTTYPIIADMAWDSNDNLYVSATTMNKVYKIKLTY